MVSLMWESAGTYLEQWLTDKRLTLPCGVLRFRTAKRSGESLSQLNDVKGAVQNCPDCHGDRMIKLISRRPSEVAQTLLSRETAPMVATVLAHPFVPVFSGFCGRRQEV